MLSRSAELSRTAQRRMPAVAISRSMTPAAAPATKWLGADVGGVIVRAEQDLHRACPSSTVFRMSTSLSRVTSGRQAASSSVISFLGSERRQCGCANLARARGRTGGDVRRPGSRAVGSQIKRGKSSSSAALADDIRKQQQQQEQQQQQQHSQRIGDASVSETDGDGIRKFRLTDVGEGIREVEVLQWFVAQGDRVRQFDKLCEVQSDKANVEITSRYDGVVRKIPWAVGDMVQTGSVLVEIEESVLPANGSDSRDGQAVLTSADEPGVPRLSVPPSASTRDAVDDTWGGGSQVSTEGSGGGGDARRQVLATPAVRRLCRELSIDLGRSAIVGTGAGGRVLKGDILAYAASTGIPLEGSALNDGAAAYSLGGEATGNVSENLFSASGRSVGWSASSEESRAVGVGKIAEEPIRAGGGDEEGQPSIADVSGGLRRREAEPVSVPIKGVQRAMMEAMRRALEVPHMTFCDEINADRLSALRSDLRDAAERRGVRLSYMPLIVKATSIALATFPSLNASLSEDKTSVLRYPDHNIGVAMDTEKGLLVPCISAVQERSVLDIAEELNTLQRLGAAGKLGEAELAGATFTLSNIGSIGGTYASPLVLHPQVCIGALGKMQRLPRFDPVDPDKVVAARVFPISWSADHRVVDGGTLARFSNTWKAYLENPAMMLANTR